MSGREDVRIVAVDTADALTAHAAAWDDLAVRAARPGFTTATYAWFASFVEHRLAEVGRSWGCLFAYDGDRLLAVLPFVRRPHGLLRGLRPWLQVPGDVNTTGGDVLVDPDRADDVLPALLDAALRTRPRPVGLRLGGLHPDTPVLRACRQRRGALVQAEGLAGRSVPLAGTWAEFHGALGSNFRRNLRKARNRLGRQGELAFETEDDADGLDRFLAIEAGGWKGDAGGAVAQQPVLLAFYRSFCRRLAARDQLTWHFLMLDEQPSAGAMALHCGTQLVLQRVAYDEAHARTSPGQLLLAHALEGWFDAGRFERVDCLTDQPWHETWRMERAPYHAALVSAPGPVGVLAGRWPARLRARLKRSALLRGLARRLRGKA